MYISCTYESYAKPQPLMGFPMTRKCLCPLSCHRPPHQLWRWWCGRADIYVQGLIFMTMIIEL